MKRFRLSVLSAAILLPLAATPVGAAPASAAGAAAARVDLILVNGVVLTMDGSGSTAEAVAVAGDRIAAVGTTAQIKAMAGPAARVVDLQGRALLPGFIDSRVHGPFGFWELSAGLALTDKTGSPLGQPEEVESALSEFMKTKKPAPYEWIVAAGFNPKLAAARKFDRALGDRVAPDNPLLLLSLDHHVALLNSRAIEKLALKTLPFPPGSGEVALDVQGQPSGLVRETPVFVVMNRVWELLPEGVRQEATARFFETASRFGITSVGEPLATPADLKTAETLLAKGDMPVRLVAGPFGPNEDARRALQAYREAGRSPDPDRLLIGPPLYSLDGTPIGWGAALFQVYHDAPWTSGFLAMPPEEIDRRVASWAAGRESVVLGASGSLAVHMILDATDRARSSGPAAGPASKEGPGGTPGQVATPLLRADGLDLVSEDDRARLQAIGRSGVVVTLQPTRFPYRVFLQNALGDDRMKSAMPYKALVEAGVAVAINSDWPMTSQTFQPTKVMEWAVGRAGWRPEEGLSVAQSLRAYTADAARALGLQDKVGSVETGKKADFVILDRNPLELAARPDQLSQDPVRMTFSNGVLVYEDRKTASAEGGSAGPPPARGTGAGTR